MSSRGQECSGSVGCWQGDMGRSECGSAIDPGYLKSTGHDTRRPAKRAIMRRDHTSHYMLCAI
eukprot:4425239-Prymnesium_polylepis.1